MRKTHMEFEGTLENGVVFTAQADVEFTRQATRRVIKEQVKANIERDSGMKVVEIQIVREGGNS